MHKNCPSHLLVVNCRCTDLTSYSNQYRYLQGGVWQTKHGSNLSDKWPASWVVIGPPTREAGLDCESEGVVAQVKHVQRLSLARRGMLEKWALFQGKGKAKCLSKVGSIKAILSG
ncbi:MAG: hypothetical protein ACREIQ_10890 [Nitrospiria bacterium]